MSTIKLDIRDDLFYFHFILKHNISFLQGNSGTGKTIFAEMIRDKVGNSEISCSISGCRDIIYVTDSNFRSFLNDPMLTDCLLVLDDLNLLSKPDFSCKTLKPSIQRGIRFLIITRRDIPDLAGATYELICENNVYILRRKEEVLEYK